MRNRFIAAVVGMLLLQVLLFGIVWANPQLKLERSYTATPSATPHPPAPTPVGPTPIPTLIPVWMGAPTRQVEQAAVGNVQCNVLALDLIGAWVNGGKPETDSFEFNSVEGKTCVASFARDVQPLFLTPNLWFNSALACAACHSSDVTESAANMSLGTYAGLLAGSRRSDNNTPGQNVLGDTGAFEKSKLYFMITTRQMPIGRPPDAPIKGPVVKAGSPK